MKFYAILHNIRSVHNVGSIFRTADAADVSKIYICGITPSPVDRLGKPRKDFEKVSLGAEKNVSWEYVPQTGRLLKRLKEEGVFIVGLEQASNSVSLNKLKTRFPVALVLGNEVDGIPQRILKLCDIVAEIPMAGRKESLNVSVAFGIAIFSLRSRLNTKPG